MKKLLEKYREINRTIKDECNFDDEENIDPHCLDLQIKLKELETEIVEEAENCDLDNLSYEDELLISAIISNSL